MALTNIINNIHKIKITYAETTTKKTTQDKRDRLIILR